MKKIMNSVEDVLSKAPEMNNNPDYAVTHSHHPGIMSTKAKDIKAPGRSRKVKRFTTLKKDFSKAKLHALYSLYGKRFKAKKKEEKTKRKIDDVEEEENKGLIEETGNGSRAFLNSNYVYDAKFLFERKKQNRC
ncbi:hypothetical protein RMCBS344292_12857 [Rhizopus microsporus]|nr:hypothetical protein RMCBS344292_12857 [Rhizopus microsporus]